MTALRAVCWPMLARGFGWGMLIGVVLLVVALTAQGGRAFTVLSGSMQPAFTAGDVIVAERIAPVDARPGDVITFKDPGSDQLIAHRVRRADRRGARVELVTRGDANRAEERWGVDADGSIGRVRWRVPAVGHVSRELAEGRRPLLLVVVPALLLLGLELGRIWAPGTGRGARRRTRPWALPPLAGRVLAAVLGAGVLAVVLTGVAAAFSSAATSVGNSITTASVFSQTMQTSAWAISDASSGVTTDRSPRWAFPEGSFYSTPALATSPSASRYLQLKFGAPVAAGLQVTDTALQVRFSDEDSTASEKACFYVDVRRRSSPTTVLGTYGSAAVPSSCENVGTHKAVSVALPAITSSTDLDDLEVRMYVWHDDAGGFQLDRATITATTPQRSVELFPEVFVDVSDGTTTGGDGACQLTTSQEGPWGLVDPGDASCLSSAGGWPTAFSATRHVTATVPAYIPPTAVVTAARLVHAYRSAGAGTACTYLEVRSGAAVLSTHGSSATPLSCVTGSATLQTDALALPAVDTAEEANALAVRVYGRSTLADATRHASLRVEVDYHVP